MDLTPGHFSLSFSVSPYLELLEVLLLHLLLCDHVVRLVLDLVVYLLVSRRRGAAAAAAVVVRLNLRHYIPATGERRSRGEEPPTAEPPT